MADDRDRTDLLKPLPMTRHVSSARPTEDEVLWPSFTDPYEAARSVRDGEIPRLVLVMGKDGFKPGATAYYVLQYVHLSLGEVGFTASGDQWFSFIYNDRPARRLRVEGINLLRICDQIGMHRMPWIRLADRDFRAGGGAASDKPVITSMTFDLWTPEDADSGRA